MLSCVLFTSNKDRDIFTFTKSNLSLEGLNSSDNLFDELFLVFVVLSESDDFLFLG